MIRKIGILALAVGLAGPLTAEETMGVSPGSIDRVVEIDRRCPTFSWDVREGAVRHELAVYRLQRGAASEVTDRNVAEEVLVQTLAGGARSWTPNLGSCFEAGETYVWFVRGVLERGDESRWSAWSRGLRFRVVDYPSRAEVSDALAAMERRAHAVAVLSARERANSRPVSASSPPSVSESASRIPSAQVTTTVAGLVGRSVAPSGESYGVVGVSGSGSGGGVAAVGPGGGADLVLDGASDLRGDLHWSETGVDGPLGTAQVFDIVNSGGGGMTLRVGATAALTTDIDQDTFAGLPCLQDKTPRWNGSSWGCAEVGLISSIVAGSGLTGGGSVGPVSLGIATAGVTASHLATNSVGSSELATGAVRSFHIVDGTITSLDINAGSVQRRVSASCSSGSAIRTVSSTGTVVSCESDRFMTVDFGDTLVLDSFNGNSGFVEWHYSGSGEHLCFLSFVQLRDIDSGSEDAYCHTYPSTGFWDLHAYSEDDSDARCRAMCYSFRP